MMDKKDAKGIALMILKAKPGKEEDMDKSEEMSIDDMEGFELAMEKFISAVKEEDVKKAIEAFQELNESYCPLMDEME